MPNRGPRRGPAQPGGRRAWLKGLLLAAVLAAGGVGARWWWQAPAGDGAPWLLVDRTDVDLGYRRFDVPVRVVFTLTNAGDGPLRLAGTPPVSAVAGCSPPEAVVGQTTIPPGGSTMGPSRQENGLLGPWTSLPPGART